MTAHDFLLFLAAGLLLNLTPGPDMGLVMARSARDGWPAGAAAALGVAAGCFVHIAAAAVGVSALLLTSAWAFTVLKWLGAVILVGMGLVMLIASFHAAASPPASPAALPAGGAPARPASLSGVFGQGFLTNALNPKVAIFFLAFLPQFIPAASSGKALLFVLLGLTFNLTGTLVNLAVAWATARLARTPSFARARAWADRVIGGLFVLIGLRLAAAEA